MGFLIAEEILPRGHHAVAALVDGLGDTGHGAADHTEAVRGLVDATRQPGDNDEAGLAQFAGEFGGEVEIIDYVIGRAARAAVISM